MNKLYTTIILCLLAALLFAFGQGQENEVPPLQEEETSLSFDTENVPSSSMLSSVPIFLGALVFSRSRSLIRDPVGYCSRKNFTQPFSNVIVSHPPKKIGGDQNRSPHLLLNFYPTASTSSNGSVGSVSSMYSIQGILPHFCQPRPETFVFTTPYFVPIASMA